MTQPFYSASDVIDNLTNYSGPISVLHTLMNDLSVRRHAHEEMNKTLYYS